MRIAPLALTVLTLGCAPSAGLLINGRPATYLEARIDKSESGMRITVDLPGGKWAIKPMEADLRFTVESEGTRNQFWWISPSERMKQDRPFIFEITDPQNGGLPFTLEIRPKYPGQGFLEGVLGIARLHYLAGEPGRNKTPQ